MDFDSKFSDRIAEFSGGWLDRELSDRLAALIKDVKVTGKKGSLTLKLDVTPRTEGDGDIVIIKPNIADKCPKVQVDPEVFRVYDDGDMEVIPKGADSHGDPDKKRRAATN